MKTMTREAANVIYRAIARKRIGIAVYEGKRRSFFSDSRDRVQRLQEVENRRFRVMAAKLGFTPEPRVSSCAGQALGCPICHYAGPR